MENVRLKMKKIDKPDESGDSSSFSCLPDEIVLQILSRLIDLKTLCHCKLVSIRFNHIVQQVNAISVTITSVDHPSFDSNSSGPPSDPDNLFKCESFGSMMKSLQTFSALKSLSIEIPHLSPRAEFNDFLFKWKFESGNRSVSFLFLSPNSVCDTKENVQDEEEQDEENVELSELKRLIAVSCLVDAPIIRYKMLHYMKCFPLLENVTITDTGKRGRLSLCGENIVPETIEQTLKSIRNKERMRWCYVPLLKLPVTGYMMKGVFLAIFEMFDLPGDDSSLNMNLNDFEDKKEAAYSEAVIEIFKKNRGWRERP